ncbi:pentatricopeptide repeat-containing protein ELI1, chloroplastic-like [Rutidosis leptorrhynchoides]|uniref:pentatricopeptide repeat-containing protein ELI1, chloroplastic-like n=1 Tax=Rutidosis leptorrhynchoides TaxID=125765 RepID=UPI003A99FE30
MLSASFSTTAVTGPTINHQPLHSPETLALLIINSKTIRQLTQIHAAAIRHELDNHPTVNFKLQRSYSSFNRLHSSLTLFNRTHDPNVYYYTSIIHSHAVHNLYYKGIKLYIQMISNNIEPNEFTFSAVLKGCPLQPGKLIHDHVVKLGFESNMHVRTALVDVYSNGGDLVYARQLFDKMPERSLVSLTSMITGYAKHGELVKARALFDEMVERDVVCWNVMIGGYVKYGKPNEALTLFREMLRIKMKVNEVTLVTILSACGQIGALESGRWIQSYIEINGMNMNVHLGTALIDMYSKCGSLEDARIVFNKLKNKDVIAYNSMITGYAMHGLSQEALLLFKNMCTMRLRPTDISFIGVLNACAHSGLVAIGKGVFLLMKTKYGIEPTIEHYGCMVNLLGRAGYLEQAYELVKNMKVHPDPVIWGTLLDSCALYKNVALAEEIVKFLVDYKLANSGTYILLSNLYAAISNWAGVARMRTMMKDHGVQKEPGCSSIEVHNKVHEFVAGDMKHPNSEQIYMMLEEVNGWLEGHGYAPQTDIVLHDVGKKERARSLEVHSEKLAIAFGLISTEPGSSIKIVKNLRVCLDCHEVTKLISKITKRTIVVRDRNRFHHFVNGLCSCGDYW